MFTLIGSLILIFKEQCFVKHRIESLATHQLFVKFISLTTRCRQRRMRIKHPSKALVKYFAQNTYFYLGNEFNYRFSYLSLMGNTIGIFTHSA